MAKGMEISVFSEATSEEVFAGRIVAGRDEQLARLIAAAARHAHALIKEFRPTQDEWRAVIGFLTEVGHASDERRQEWVLLSDLLGASSLVEEINTRRPKGATPNTIRGPFFRSDAPERAADASISLDGSGEPLFVTLRVRDLDGKPISGAEVITWQANSQGLYENQQPDLQPEHNLRGRFRSDAEGLVRYRSVVPGGYSVPDDGPVGGLMTKAGYPLHRPAHLHFIVRAPGFETITTHIYDAADPRLAEDALFGVRPELVAPFETVVRNGLSGKAVELSFTMVRARTTRAG